ncbi:MAG: hypothetical protein AB1942_20000 [Pseudomonadota bacterium]
MSVLEPRSKVRPGAMMAWVIPHLTHSAPSSEDRPLRDRIVETLQAGAMTAPSLASLLGAKELNVGLTLAALQQEGAIAAGPPPASGPRHRPWTLTGGAA